MDTVTEVTLILPSNISPTPIWKAIDSLLKDWDERFSVTGEKSEIEILNKRKVNICKVSSQLSSMIEMALRYGDTLNGMFDISILPIKELWGFGEESSDTQPLPDEEIVDSVIKYVSYKEIKLTGNNKDTIEFLSPYTQIDVGGIAKGFVLYEIASLLDKRDVKSYLVAAGGDIVCKGNKVDGKPWIIGIQHPRKADGILATFSFTNGSVVTSGDYERFRIVNGKRYHHIFNSKTGRCCTNNQSVTIAGLDPREVDILSTGLFCFPAKDIVAYVNKRPHLNCVVVDSAGNIFISEEWKTKIKILN